MKLSAVLRGYSSVAHAAEVLHLAPRSVRDLIYSGRLPSVRIGRWHFIRATDLERERRRRLGLPLHTRPRSMQSATSTPKKPRTQADPAHRAQRAAERTAARREWAAHHRRQAPALPFTIHTSGDRNGACSACHQPLQPGSPTLESSDQPAHVLCLGCGRRELLAWSDQRRMQAAAARDLAQRLGSPMGGEVSERAAA